MYISELKIRNYKNFEKSTFKFNDNMNTIIGENGTGKTNLFNALRLLFGDNIKLDSKSFTNQISRFKGEWIIITAHFKELSETVEELAFGPDENNCATYSLIYRPKREIRQQLYILGQDLSVCPKEQKEEKKEEIKSYIHDIDVDNDYEIVRKVRSDFDICNDSSYKEVVGDFEEYKFTNPDEQDNKALIGDYDKGVSNYVNVTFVPAIRDVNLELTRKNNFFYKMLDVVNSEVDSTSINLVKEKVKQLNDTLSSIEGYTNFSEGVFNTTQDAVGGLYSSELNIDVNLPNELNELTRFFRLKGVEGENEIDLYNKSLGENNVLYFALKIFEMNKNIGNSKNVLSILLIEEPEAHIHCHLQKTLFKGIKGNNNSQVFLSTHSINISESANISSMNILSKNRDKTSIYCPSNNLSDLDIRYLERYLDLSRTSLLFSKCLILVEGIAEKIMIPELFKIKYDIDFDALGISIISVEGCFFEKLSILFNADRIRKKVVIFTDCDKDYTKDGKFKDREEKAKSRLDSLFAKHADNEYVNVYTNDYTFEIEFYRDNIEVFIEYIEEKEVYKRDLERVKQELRDEDKDVKYSRIIKIATKLGKGWLALDFTMWLTEKKIDSFCIPQYIVDGVLDFINEDQYSKDTISKLLKQYCKHVGIEYVNISNTDDNFIHTVFEELNDE